MTADRRRASRKEGEKGRSRLKTLLLFLGVFLWIPVTMGLVLYYLWVAVPYRGYPGSRVIVQVPHQSARRVLRVLEEQGVIRPSPLGRLYLALTGHAGDLKAGEYLFEEPMTAPQVLEKLIRGEIYYHKVTVPEGLRSGEIFAAFLRQGFGDEEEFHAAFLDVARIAEMDPGATDLEGYLFPDTYLVRKDIKPREMVALMVGHFRKNFSNTFTWRARDIGFSTRQAVIMASLVEKETSNRDERFLVSSVFHNRLRKNMLLDCDSTIIYALKKAGAYDGDLRWGDADASHQEGQREKGHQAPIECSSLHGA